jgi:hypothetical protein
MKLRDDPTRTPSETEWGGHRRVFAGLTETVLAQYIRYHARTKSRLFTSDDFKTMAFEH